MNRNFIFICALFSLAGYCESVSAQETFFPLLEMETEYLSPEVMTGDDKIIYLRDQWKFMPGDSLKWSEPGYDDSQWDLISTNLTQADLSFVEWNGMGWFRKELKVAPELRQIPVALLIDRHLGASEIYLNGDKIYELGSFSTDPSLVETFTRTTPLAIVFPDHEDHVLAVRFINPDITETERQVGYNGFRFLLGDWETHQQERFTFIAAWTSQNMFSIGILLAFAIIHFLLFAFYPAEKRNLYFSLFVALLAAFSYLIFRFEMSSFTFDALFFFRFISVAEVIVLAFAAKFTHSIDSNSAPIYTNVILPVGLSGAVLIWVLPFETVWLREFLVLVFVLEILRTVLVMFSKNLRGAWILGFGILVFVAGLLYGIMVNFELIQGNIQTGNMVGAGFLVLSMSIYLSREFAFTQKHLLQKLEEVKLLSKKTLQQEKISKQREIEKRLLEAENDRKSKELKEARALQLSMLPRSLPSIEGYDIAVFMETATEVGGDYYDYSLTNNGSVLLAVGDATGHGMKAGIMVAAAKSYFHTLAHEYDGLSMMKRISSGLRNLNLKMMYMGMMLIYCRDSKVDITTAGMPPALHYICDEKRVNRITLKGLPLGSNIDYPYDTCSFELNSGDVLFLMSDGLSELFNDNREMLDLIRIEEMLKKASCNSANEIISHFSQLIRSWSGGEDPHDDITMMVLKKT